MVLVSGLDCTHIYLLPQQARTEQGELQHQEWVLGVLKEHRRLEEQRAREYELLFSEEAARLWEARQQQWEQEARARGELLREVRQICLVFFVRR